MKLDKADTVFSYYIRLRDKMCRRCSSLVRFNDKGLPNSHQCSHFFGRTREGTRFEPDNCDTLCHGCHRFWEKEDREAYREFKIHQLGEDRLNELMLQSRTYHKKDRELERIYWSGELNKLLRLDMKNNRVKLNE